MTGGVRGNHPSENDYNRKNTLNRGLYGPIFYAIFLLYRDYEILSV